MALSVDVYMFISASAEENRETWDWEDAYGRGCVCLGSCEVGVLAAPVVGSFVRQDAPVKWTEDVHVVS